ncbi:uncharacterized protein LOC132797914 [Drosophila nasuta]|uniref:uncharacterized protein LOC132797914 n=1 Tax=Drosophila nasuta TaxID=42062 RepID=UPI00295EF265|nr:uncharacterized protein LOC132797914 [Drosophila nasuta]
MASSRSSSCSLSDEVCLRRLFSPARPSSPPTAGSPPRQVAQMETEPSPAPVAPVTPRGVSVPRRAAPAGGYVPAGTNSFRCRVCRGVHALRKCPRFAQLTPEKRLRAVLVIKYCPNCLAHQHSGGTCRSCGRCRHCGEDHHTILHMRDLSSKQRLARQPSGRRDQPAPSIPSSSRMNRPTAPHTKPVPGPAMSLTALLQCKGNGESIQVKCLIAFNLVNASMIPVTAFSKPTHYLHVVLLDCRSTAVEWQTKARDESPNSTKCQAAAPSLSLSANKQRIATIQITAKFFNISLICAHAPTEEKDDATKDAFYADLVRAYGRCPSHDIKILLGDFNAKVGREDIFGATVGRFSLHETTSSNGLRLIGFAAAHNMVVRSTGFRHLDIHKASWLSPDRLTRNQIDHVVIDARHASSILDVRSCRGPNIDSDHYLVAAKIRTRLCVAKIARRRIHGPIRSVVTQQLQGRRLQKNTAGWGDTSYCGRLQVEKKIRKRLFRRKKKEQERRDRVKRLTEGFKSGAVACRDDDGNLVTEAEVVLRLWRDHFSSLLSGSEDYDPRTPIYGTDIEVPIPSHIEVKDAIQRLKNNKSAGADGLPAELFKAAGDMLVGSMHQLISKIWLTESMPEDWNLSMICPILKKGDATVRTNYRGISLLPVAYKVLTSCGFRPGKSTVDQIFTLRQILEKSYENQIDTYHLFVDYKAAFDSPRRDRLYAAMSELDIPAKLTRLCRMTLSNTISSVNVDVANPKPLLPSVASDKLLGYADDIDIIGRTKRDVTGAFGAIEKESAKVGLAVNMEKTKFMVCSSRELRRLDSQLTAENYSYGSVKEFIYLGTAITSTNDVSLEIKRRITLANSQMQLLLECSRGKFFAKIFGPICVDDVYRIRYNHELYELYGDVDVANRVKSQRLRWLGHVARMDEDAPARKVFDAMIVGTRRRGRPRTCWQDQVMETLSTLGVTNWRRRAQDRAAWRHIALQAETR